MWSYYSKTPGIGGKLKEQVEDFVVEEIADIRLKDNGKCLILKLTKYGLTTIEAIEMLSSTLRISPSRFGYAGNKDKRAITTQYISVKNAEPEEMMVFSPNMEIEVIGKGDHITPKVLIGNRFEITVRNIPLRKAETISRVEKILEELNGYFPNYFGIQRFGNRKITPIVGKEILKGNYEEAVWLYIGKTENNELEKIRKIRKELYDNRNAENAAEKFPKQYRYEKLLLYHLAKRPKDYIGAIKSLPIQIQRLFVHTYQSYIFNEILSEIIKTESDKEEVKKIYLPIVGYNTVLKGSPYEKAILNIMRKDGIGLESFKIKEFPYLSSKGTYRKCFAKYKKFRILAVEEDELNVDKIKITVKFELGKGSYATSLLREFMKTPDLDY